MIKAIIFDADGVVIKSGPRFSDYLEQDYGIPTEITKDLFCVKEEAPCEKSRAPFCYYAGVGLATRVRRRVLFVNCCSICRIFPPPPPLKHTRVYLKKQ